MKKLLLVLALGFSLGSAAYATPLTIGAGWSDTTDVGPAFFWGSGAGAMNDNGPFTFTASGLVNLSITDAFNTGDRFQVFDFGSSIGTTSVPTESGNNYTSDPNLSFGDARYSFGTFLLGAGAHSITISTIVNPFGGGRGYIRVDEARSVPETGSTLVFAGLGLISLVALKPRRKSVG